MAAGASRMTYLAVFGQGVLLRAGSVQDLLAFAVQDDQVGEAGLLNFQCGQQQAEHAGCIGHQPLQRDTPHHLQCMDNDDCIHKNYLSASLMTNHMKSIMMITITMILLLIKQ